KSPAIRRHRQLHFPALECPGRDGLSRTSHDANVNGERVVGAAETQVETSLPVIPQRQSLQDGLEVEEIHEADRERHIGVHARTRIPWLWLRKKERADVAIGKPKLARCAVAAAPASEGPQVCPKDDERVQPD